MKHRVWGALVAALLLGVACGGGGQATSSSTSSTPLRVLNVAAVTGAAGATGLAWVTGEKTAALVLNQQGGILGHKIDVTTFDTGGSATQGLSILTEQLAGGTWNIAYTGANSDEQTAMAPKAMAAKVIGFCPCGTLSLGDPTTYPYHFLMTSNADVLAGYMVKDAQKTTFRKLGLLTEDNSYGQQEHAWIGSALKSAGSPYVDAVFSATALDITPTLLQMQAQGVDYVIWDALGASIGYVLKSRVKANFMVPFLGDAGVSSTTDIWLIAVGGWLVWPAVSRKAGDTPRTG